MVDPFAVTIAAAENAVMNGVTILRETGFEDFVFEKSGRRCAPTAATSVAAG